jgi:phage internal scaffolding protein
MSFVKRPDSGPAKCMVQQHPKEGCDINVLVANYMKMRSAPPIPEHPFVEMPVGVDMLDMMCQVRRAEEAFAALPSNVRNRVGNRPESLMRFLADPANHDESVKLGLRPPAEAPSAPMRVEVVNPSVSEELS